MQPKIIINAGGLEQLKINYPDFLNFLGLNLQGAEASKNGSCPKCKRKEDDVFLKYYLYVEDLRAHSPSCLPEGLPFNCLVYHLCLCGTIYSKEECIPE